MKYQNLLIIGILLLGTLGTLHGITITPAYTKAPLQPRHGALPVLPTGFQSPRFHGLPQVIHSAHDLTLLFDSTKSTLTDLVSTKKANPFIFKNLPRDFNSLPVKEKTSNFIAFITPHIIEVNTDILKVRSAIDALRDKKKRGESFSVEESTWIAFVATQFRLKSPNLDTLHSRINTIPVALMVAQAINESGWGTSRFAIEGNAIFGQHATKKGNLDYMVSRSGTARVAAFDDLYLCMAGYLLNINRNMSYRYLRSIRAAYERKGQPVTGHALAQGLIKYSIRGQEYVDELRGIIRRYNLEALNSVEIDTTKQLNYYQFTR